MMVRKSARAILKNKNNEFLLFKFKFEGFDSDRQKGAEGLWIVPGGGIEENETLEEAVLREVREETGFVFKKAGPLVWTRKLKLLYQGKSFVSEEYFYYFENLDKNRISMKGFSANEKKTFLGAKWLKIEEIEALESSVSPSRLSKYLRDLEVNIPLKAIEIRD